MLATVRASAAMFPLPDWRVVTGTALGTIVVLWAVRLPPAWMAMWIIAVVEFAALKLVTLARDGSGAGLGRKWGYVLLWPGMDARAFLGPRDLSGSTVSPSEWSYAFAKLGLGLALMAWGTRHASDAGLLVAWVGMLGIIFALHFGVLHLMSCAWRAVGVAAPPIMRCPIAATSLAEFWGARWNLAFADAARRLVFRPVARRHGAGRAGAAVFLLSGLVHETVTSLPARGGWGGPTLYFVLQAVGVAAEKTRAGRALGLGHGFVGWIWTVLVAGAPLPLLFHEPFAREVILPFYRALGAFLP